MATKATKFNACKKGWFLTFPHCSVPKDKMLDHLLELGAARAVVAQEHHSDGELHLHCWAEWDSKLHVRSQDYFDFEGYHCNIGNRDDAHQSRQRALQYLNKEDNEPAAFGIDPQSYLDAKKNHRKVIGKELLLGKKTLREAVDENPELLFCLSSLKKNLQIYKNMAAADDFAGARKCYWIHGQPGIGKSYSIRAKYGDECFVKAYNKWWDGYIAQSVVLVDDVDSDCLKHLMKIWADNYAFEAETKGGSIKPSYNTLFVTSNYTIEEIFKEEKLVAAIKRRFKEVNGDDYIGENGYFNLDTILD